MCQAARKISLGFTEQEFEAGIHICQIFNDDDERHDALVRYLLSGLRDDEDVCCFSERESEDSISRFLGAHGISLEDCRDQGAFSFSRASGVYFQDDRFDPDRMIALLKSFQGAARDRGRAGARVIGEMTPEVQHVKGGELLAEYESRVSQLLRTCPVTAVCQYDARLFDGSTILDILRVHPFMIIRGAVVSNPFFIPPEEFLSQKARTA